MRLLAKHMQSCGQTESVVPDAHSILVPSCYDLVLDGRIWAQELVLDLRMERRSRTDRFVRSIRELMKAGPTVLDSFINRAATVVVVYRDGRLHKAALMLTKGGDLIYYDPMGREHVDVVHLAAALKLPGNVVCYCDDTCTSVQQFLKSDCCVAITLVVMDQLLDCQTLEQVRVLLSKLHQPPSARAFAAAIAAAL